ncbi:MAG: cohesin domain-containing protein [bacterium]
MNLFRKKHHFKIRTNGIISINYSIVIIFSLVFFSFFTNVSFVWAQDVFTSPVFTNSLNNQSNVQMYISPRNGNFVTGSILEVGVYIDTKKNSINTVDLKVNFDPKKLAVANPSGGKSIFDIWVEPPTYDNTKGLITMSGIIPEGIVTTSGLIAKMSFKVLSAGSSTITINNATNVYLNDGAGTKANVSFGRAELEFTNQIPDGVVIHSDTHPFEDNWYNNNNPIFSWDDKKDSNGYATLLDSNPKTVPTNEITTNKNNMSYTDIGDGTWYMHVKSKEDQSWGNTSNYKINIDTTPPKKFTPTINTITGDGRDEYVLMFGTTDDLSGIDHYEVGILKNNRDKNTLPVFIQTESPYVLPVDNKENIKIIVKAFDVAGNVTEGSTSLYPNNKNWYIAGLFFLILILLVSHYVFGHHVGRNIKRAYIFFKNISKKDENNQF